MLPATYALPAALVFLASGALACFLGHRLFRLVLGVYGFVLGALMASAIMPAAETLPMLLVSLAGGVAGAIVLVFAYFVGVALAGAALAALLVHAAWGQFGGEPHVLALIGACVLGALVSLALQRYVIIFGTAFGGAWTFLVGLLTLMGRYEGVGTGAGGSAWLTYPLNPAPGERWMPIAWLILGSVGVIVQLGWTSPRARAGGGRSRKAKRAA